MVSQDSWKNYMREAIVNELGRQGVCGAGELERANSARAAAVIT